MHLPTSPAKAGCRLLRAEFVNASASAFAAVAVVKSPAKAAQFEFKCGANQATDHPVSIRQVQMWATVEQETGGRVHTQYFPNSLLGGDTAMFQQLRSGALEFFMINPGNLASVVPVADIGYLGFAYKDDDEALRVANGPVGAYVRQEIDAKGMHCMRYSWGAGMNEVTCSSHPIRNPDDMRGYKVRVPESRILVDLFKDLGASTSTLSFSELYTALQTKLVDGMAGALASIEASRFYEVQKYLSLTNHAWSGAWLVANADVWNRLPPDIQQTIERNAAKYGMLLRADIRTMGTSLAAKLGSQGMTVNTVDQTPFRAPLGAYYRSWADTFGPTVWGRLQTALGRKFT
jgi:TRAP-type transport system periplasmic protein